MLFGQAMIEVMAGKRARRETWNDGDYIFLSDSNSTIRLSSSSMRNEQEYNPSHEDMTSDDWIVFYSLPRMSVHIQPIMHNEQMQQPRSYSNVI